MNTDVATANQGNRKALGVAAAALESRFVDAMGRRLTEMESAVLASMEPLLPQSIDASYEALEIQFVRRVLAAELPVTTFLKGTPIRLLWRNRSLGEAEYIARLLKLANGALSEDELVEMMLGVAIKRGRAKSAHVSESLARTVREQLSLAIHASARQWNELRKRALVGVENRYFVTGALEGDARRIVFETEEAACSYALLLLADRGRPYAGSVSQCRYRQCGRYFLVQRTQTIGRTARDHCCNEHKKLELTLRNRERVKKYKQDKGGK